MTLVHEATHVRQGPRGKNAHASFFREFEAFQNEVLFLIQLKNELSTDAWKDLIKYDPSNYVSWITQAGGKDIPDTLAIQQYVFRSYIKRQREQLGLKPRPEDEGNLDTILEKFFSPTPQEVLWSDNQPKRKQTPFDEMEKGDTRVHYGTWEGPINFR